MGGCFGTRARNLFVSAFLLFCFFLFSFLPIFLFFFGGGGMDCVCSCYLFMRNRTARNKPTTSPSELVTVVAAVAVLWRCSRRWSTNSLVSVRQCVAAK